MTAVTGGIDGVGLGLCKHHHALGKIFDIWCLHIPVKDRTPFLGLVKLVERTVRSENCHSPNRPIYLLGESLGACLALAVAARNPDVNLSLVLSNPGEKLHRRNIFREVTTAASYLFLGNHAHRKPA
ncbi:unnamed protein product [Dovyalis caffra]|uniref:Serine aminopeptidase S33 domain-containing protein n=1 Tax=Dovyalis caffra TaxID=77055 RepID=A0AAV1R4P0_9ROSI|nr:unnamed protein product [Dovyalis caffra]